MRRPRVRGVDGNEIKLRTWEMFAGDDVLNERAVEQMVIGVSTRKFARSLEPVDDVKTRGTRPPELIEGPHDQRSFSDERHALGPRRGDVCKHERMHEASRAVLAAVRHEVRLDEAWHRLIPV